ncbi:MAG: CBS domain-containing protein [Thermodesulfovibrionales bacterium]|nr:CBS domain-containing protein [Thermodesulfovibrionales bacterium]
MLKAKDIMKTDIVTVTGDMTVEELGRLFIERGISGAPVVDRDGRLLGVVTENDLISRNKRIHIPTMLRIFDAFIPIEPTGTMEDEMKRMSATTVSEICVKDVLTITEETTIEEIATIMAEHRVHLLPVIREGKVAGIVGKHEVIKGISS